MNRDQAFDKYGVEPFGPRTVWKVAEMQREPDMLVGCQGTKVGHRPCSGFASWVVQWRAETMSAPAFWYFCDKHAEPYIAWREALDTAAINTLPPALTSTPRDLAPAINTPATAVAIVLLDYPHLTADNRIDWTPYPGPGGVEVFKGAHGTFEEARQIVQYLRAHHPGMDAHIDQRALEWHRVKPHPSDEPAMDEWFLSCPYRVREVLPITAPAYRVVSSTRNKPEWCPKCGGRRLGPCEHCGDGKRKAG